ncbi:MAG: two pore domain potassium channel family protein [Rhizobiaceae bacterium]|nr:two pore domain potassium channel family protein [Rhizobiaceae bacterium]
MTIVTQILLGSIVLGICSMLHIVLLVAAIKLLRRMAPHDRASRSLLHVIKLLVLGFGIVLFAHTLQVWIWALSFIALGTLPNISDAIYFSLVTYTTVGYGDVTVGGGFRVFGAMAAVTGLLNFGLSTAFLVGLFERMLPNQLPPPQP